jgi:hypothetical protein
VDVDGAPDIPVEAGIVQTMPPWDQTGVPLHFTAQTTVSTAGS